LSHREMRGCVTSEYLNRLECSGHAGRIIDRRWTTGQDSIASNGVYQHFGESMRHLWR